MIVVLISLRMDTDSQLRRDRSLSDFHAIVLQPRQEEHIDTVELPNHTKPFPVIRQLRGTTLHVSQ